RPASQALDIQAFGVNYAQAIRSLLTSCARPGTDCRYFPEGRVACGVRLQEPRDGTAERRWLVSRASGSLRATRTRRTK
ncbi:MAG TPA: hypothetical protein VFU02_09940, partial [Polyangiaceae bacterium]|nr:hypothetical protein [Polyangiaceae bacterium]